MLLAPTLRGYSSSTMQKSHQHAFEYGSLFHKFCVHFGFKL